MEIVKLMSLLTKGDGTLFHTFLDVLPDESFLTMDQVHAIKANVLKSIWVLPPQRYLDPENLTIDHFMFEDSESRTGYFYNFESPFHNKNFAVSGSGGDKWILLNHTTSTQVSRFLKNHPLI